MIDNSINPNSHNGLVIDSANLDALLRELRPSQARRRGFESHHPLQSSNRNTRLLDLIRVEPEVELRIVVVGILEDDTVIALEVEAAG